MYVMYLLMHAAFAIKGGLHPLNPPPVVGSVITFDGISSEICSGVLIDKHIVVTAAHCVLYDAEISTDTPGTFEVPMNTSFKTYAVLLSAFHPSYNGVMFQETPDLGLLILSRSDSQINNYSYVDGSPQTAGPFFSASGYGPTANPDVDSGELSGRGDLIGDVSGDHLYFRDSVTFPMNSYLCQGDSGGPVREVSGSPTPVVAINSFMLGLPPPLTSPWCPTSECSCAETDDIDNDSDVEYASSVASLIDISWISEMVDPFLEIEEVLPGNECPLSVQETSSFTSHQDSSSFHCGTPPDPEVLLDVELDLTEEESRLIIASASDRDWILTVNMFMEEEILSLGGSAPYFGGEISIHSPQAQLQVNNWTSEYVSMIPSEPPAVYEDFPQGCDEWDSGPYMFTESVRHQKRVYRAQISNDVIDALDPSNSNQIILHMKADVEYSCTDLGPGTGGTNFHHATLGIDALSLENASFGLELPFEL